MNSIKKILFSKLFRLLISVGLIYFAFRKIDIIKLFSEITTVPIWFLVVMIGYMVVTMFIGGWRWSLILLKKVSIKDVWVFTKATYLGAFYGIVFPTAMAGDLLKWMPITKKYPELSKTRIAGSVLIDRIIGFSAFVVMAFGALILGKSLKYSFSPVLFWLFLGLFLGVVTFYIVVFSVDLVKIFGKLFEKIKILRKLLEVVDLLRNENKKRILSVFLISVIAEPVWMLPVWFYSQIFKVGISLMQVYIFMPVISLILVLPISIAGFGARENLFLLFFSQLGYADEKILLISTFSGIISILNSLIGGLFLLI